MQWFAYLVWGALGLCLLGMLATYLYARRCPDVATRPVDNDRSSCAVVSASEERMDESRWRSLLASIPLAEDDVSATTCAQRLEWATALFGVQRSWLQGDDVAMYPCLSFHNAVDRSFDFVAEKIAAGEPLRLIAAKQQGLELDETVYDAQVVLCFATQVSWRQQTMWRFWPVNVSWEWGYLPEQVQCRQIIHIACAAGCEVVGVELDAHALYQLLEGRAIPSSFQTLCTAGPWDPKALASAGSEVAGQGPAAVSAQQLQQKIQRAGWPINCGAA